MSFDSPAFVVLLVAGMVLVRLRLRGVGSLGISAVFYAFAGAFDFMRFAAILIANGLAAVLVPRSRAVFWLTVAGNLAVLAAFKYRDMLLPSTLTQEFTRVAIPLGISFYLFHILTYVIDLRAGRVRLIPFRKFVLFVSFFPRLIAGSIVRAQQLVPQLEPLWRGRIVRNRLAIFGLAMGLVGLVKKVVFANSLAPVVDDLFWTVPEDMLTAWPAHGSSASRSISISPVTPTSRWARRCCSGCAFHRISARHTWLPIRRNSGGAGTSRCRAGSAIISTSLSAVGRAACGGRPRCCCL